MKSNRDCNFEPMEILKEELPVIRKMVQDECWYMGEALKRPVDQNEVQGIVNKIVLTAGEQMREEAVEKLKATKCCGDCTVCKYKSSL